MAHNHQMQLSCPAFGVRPLSSAIGAEIHGVDLARELSAETIAALRRAWLDHVVIFFRDQHLAPAEFMAFAQRFGRPVEYPFLKGLPGFPEITPVVKLAHETVNFGGVWHSDTTYLERPPMGTMLIAREMPSARGDTLFANQYLAYESLTPCMREVLGKLTAVNSSAKADVTRSREDRLKADGREDARRDFAAEHPVVRTHPETGRRALYVNTGHTVRFGNMTERESAPLLAFLHAHQIKPEFTCRFTWSPGSIAFWDNRAAQHYPVNDYHGHRRVMHRITLAGDVPR
jgi:taurine dioxygenase